MKLPLKQFRTVVRDTALVALDLVLVSGHEEVLLGERRNPPAKGYWFVPGGRIWKGERLRDALRRISKTELGMELAYEKARLLGVYEHLYEENFTGDSSFSTHYVVISCRFEVGSSLPTRYDDQHDKFMFYPIRTLLDQPQVHRFTKNYFVPDADNLFLPGEALKLSADFVVPAGVTLENPAQ